MQGPQAKLILQKYGYTTQWADPVPLILNWKMFW
jgi:hypothetical protein